MFLALLLVLGQTCCPSGRCPVPPGPPHTWAAPVVPPEITLPPPARATAPAAAPAPADPLGDALRILNAGRAKIGAPAFVLDARLCESAYSHSKDLATGRVDFATDAHSGFPQRILATGFPFTGTLSEGVFPQAPGVNLPFWTDWLVKNPREAHGRDFADASYRTIGVGIADGTGGKYSSFITIEYSQITTGVVPPPPPGPVTPTVPAPRPQPPKPPAKPQPPTKPVKPAPPVVVVRPSPQGPGGGADTASLANAARFYYLDFPLELRGVAGDVATGKIADLDGLVAAIKAARARASQDMDKRLGEALAPMLNADGSIADRAGVAGVMRAIADAMTETQIHAGK